MMNNTMANVKFKNAKLFYAFRAHTKPWDYAKRKGLAALLNTLTRRTETDACGWLTKTRSSIYDPTVWHFPALGPQQPAWVGAIHVSSSKYTWHSTAKCNIGIFENPSPLMDAIKLDVITTW